MKKFKPRFRVMKLYDNSYNVHRCSILQDIQTGVQYLVQTGVQYLDRGESVMMLRDEDNLPYCGEDLVPDYLMGAWEEVSEEVDE